MYTLSIVGSFEAKAVLQDVGKVPWCIIYLPTQSGNQFANRFKLIKQK